MLGYENDVSRGMAADLQGRAVWFTRLHETDNGAFLRASDDTLCYAENGAVTPVLPRSEVKLRGLHNVENLLAAIAAVWGRVPVEAMRRVGSTFYRRGAPHRAGAPCWTACSITTIPSPPAPPAPSPACAALTAGSF